MPIYRCWVADAFGVGSWYVVTQDLIERFDTFMGQSAVNTERLQAFLEVLHAVRRLPKDDRRTIVARHREIGNSNYVRLHSVIGYLTGDPYEYDQILNWLTLALPQIDPAMAHFVFWGIQSQVFLGGLRGPKAAAFAECNLFRFYQAFLNSIAARFAIRPVRKAARLGPIRRACLVTNQFLGERHQPSRDVFDYAWRLREEQGVETVIVNANLMPLKVEALFFPPIIAEIEESYEGGRRLCMWDKVVPVVSFTGRAFDAAKLRMIAQTIEDADPDVLIAFGGSNIVVDLFAGARPTVCLPTTSGVTLTLADCLLGYDGTDWTLGLDELYREPFARRFRPFTLGFAIPPTNPETAGDFGLTGASFVFAIVGTRLDTEVDESFLALVDDILDTRAGSVAVFAGGVESLPQWIPRCRNAERMRVLGHVNDIRAFYRRTGAFLNPPRQGGGGSAGFALAEGVPVVTFGAGDVGGVVGQDFHVSSRSDYVATAGRLANDPAHWAAMAEKARRRYAEIGDRALFAKRLLAYCEDARTAYRS